MDHFGNVTFEMFNFITPGSLIAMLMAILVTQCIVRCLDFFLTCVVFIQAEMFSPLRTTLLLRQRTQSFGKRTLMEMQSCKLLLLYYDGTSYLHQPSHRNYLHRTRSEILPSGRKHKVSQSLIIPTGLSCGHEIFEN